MDPKFIERLTYALIAAVALATGYLLKTQGATAPLQAQPSVPGLIAPACPGPNCSGSCNPARRRHSPFRVVCPNCRTSLNVQEPSLGDTVPAGEVVGEAPAK